MTRTRLSTSRQPRRGFTLIELLVVISIIAVLVSLVAPAVQAARRTARRLQCLSNMRQVGIAMQAFSATSGTLPTLTYDLQTDASGAVIYGVGWPMALLPALDNAAVLKNIKQFPQILTNGSASYYVAYNAAQTTGSNNNVWLNFFTCPDDSDSDHKPGGLSFVVNAGFIRGQEWGTILTNPFSTVSESINVATAPLYNGSTMHQPYAIDWDGLGNYSSDGYTPLPAGNGFDSLDQAIEIATGVIFRATTGPGSNSFQPTFDYVSTGDGQSNTILLTENLNAGPWNGSAAYGNGVNHFGFGVAVETSNFAPSAGLFGTSTGYLNTENGRIWNAASYPDFWMINRNLNLGSSGAGIAPRPSSQHSGGVNTVFCDGRGLFLSENVDKQVYIKVCTSNGGAYGEYTLNSQSFSN